jgi:ribosomal protein S18 acetylase RimI-like enzyme
VQNLIIRKARVEDVEELAILFNDYRQFYAQPNDLALATSFINCRLNNMDSEILVAVDSQQKIIGFCQLYPTFCSVIAAPIYVLYDLFVDSTARKSGAGRLLMLAAHELAKNNGVARLDLTTAKNNHVAQKLYESLSWVRDEVFYTYNKVV